MSHFATHLILEAVSDRREGLWRVAQPLVYWSSSQEMAYIVPIGFETDLASVPRLPLVYWLTGGCGDHAGTLHDWLYTSCEVSRAVADKLFREAAAATGVPAWRRWLMWCGIRIGGASHYGNRSKRVAKKPA